MKPNRAEIGSKIFNNVRFWKSFLRLFLVGSSLLVLFYAAQSSAFQNIQPVQAIQGCDKQPDNYPQCGAAAGSCRNISGEISNTHTVRVVKGVDDSCNFTYDCTDLGVIVGQCGNPTQTCNEQPANYPQCGGTCNGVTFPGNHTVQVNKSVDSSCTVSWQCQDLGVINGQCGNNPAPAPASVACNDNAVSLSASPSSVNVGQSINFAISGDASTFIGDSFSGGVDGCSGSWNSRTCQANQAGNFTWTHTWRHCVGDTNNCSGTCTKQTSFSVMAAQQPPACVSNGSCSASAPACGTTTSGVDNCGNACTKQGVACPPPAQPPVAPTRNITVQCPDGSSVNVSAGRDINFNTLCQQQQQQQTQIATGGNAVASGGSSSSSSQGGSSTVTITNPTPQVVFATSGNVGVATPQVLGVTTLPKTGLPEIAWSALAFIPAGFGMRRFRSIKKTLADDPHYIWENRKFKAGS